MYVLTSAPSWASGFLSCCSHCFIAYAGGFNEESHFIQELCCDACLPLYTNVTIKVALKVHVSAPAQAF